MADEGAGVGGAGAHGGVSSRGTAVRGRGRLQGRLEAAGGAAGGKAQRQSQGHRNKPHL